MKFSIFRGGKKNLNFSITKLKERILLYRNKYYRKIHSQQIADVYQKLLQVRKYEATLTLNEKILSIKNNEFKKILRLEEYLDVNGTISNCIDILEACYNLDVINNFLLLLDDKKDSFKDRTISSFIKGHEEYEKIKNLYLSIVSFDNLGLKPETEMERLDMSLLIEKISQELTSLNEVESIGLKNAILDYLYLIFSNTSYYV